jgi:hypothetical protein
VVDVGDNGEVAKEAGVHGGACLRGHERPTARIASMA